MVDTKDLKSFGTEVPCGFESRFLYLQFSLISVFGPGLRHTFFIPMIIKLIDFMPRLVCSLLTVALILWLTLAPHPVGEMDVPLFPGADKLVHAIMFGFLAWVLYIDLGKVRNRAPSRLATLLCALAAGAFGAATEWMQGAMHAGRSMEGADLVADLSGAALACLLILLLRNRLPALRH